MPYCLRTLCFVTAALLGPAVAHADTLRFAGAGEGVTLAGTFTAPSSTQRLPAVVLVHGSGPMDRDHTAFGHKLFANLAAELNRAGYAVLRYDKRGVGESSGDGRRATTLDLAADARRAVEAVAQRPEVDPTRVAVAGVSEGGSIAAITCASDAPVAACVSMAGLIARFAEQMPLQEILVGQDQGADPAYPAAVREGYARLLGIYAEPDAALRGEQIKALSADWLGRFPKGDVNRPAAEDSLLARPRMLAGDWMRGLMLLDTESIVRQGKARPILFLNGSTDRQVDATLNLAAARRALGAETPLRRTLVIPRLNHMLQESDSGSTETYDRPVPTPAASLVQAVTGFLSQAMPAAKASAQSR